MLNTIVSYSAAGYMLRERCGGERGGERKIKIIKYRIYKYVFFSVGVCVGVCLGFVRGR